MQDELTDSKRKRKEYPVRDWLLEKAKKGCGRLGGAALIDGSFWLVDATKYNITKKN